MSSTTQTAAVSTPNPSENKPFPLRRLLIIGTVIVLWVLYSNILHAPFVYDDKIEVVGNRTIRFWSEWQDILLYNPARALLQITYAYNFQTSQFDPFDYHITNLLIHSLTICTAFFASEQLARLWKLPSPVAFAFILTAWWALHPMGIESVTYITGRSESFCALFAFGAVGLKALHLQNDSRSTLFGAWLAAILSVMVKEVGVMVPLIFFSMEWIYKRQISKGTLILIIVGGVGFFGLRTWLVWRGLEDPTVVLTLSEWIPREVDRSLHVQLLTQTESWVRYMGLWTFPKTQTLFHHIPDADMSSWQTYGWLTGWVALMGGAWFGSRNSPLMRLALMGGILVLLPSSSIAALQENMAEHRSHQFGFFFGLYLLTAVWKFHNHRIMQGFCTVLILGLCYQTHQRNNIWTSEVRLWQEATLVNPESPKAWYGLGDAHRFAKQFNPSLAAFAQCTRLDPMEMDCWNNLGIVYAEMSNVDKARETWLQALEHNSAYCKAHTNLGFLSYRQEDWDDALVEFRSALVYCPTNVIAHYGLGLLYYGPRLDVQKAIHHFDKVLVIDPTFDYAADARKKLLDLTW